MLNWGSQNLPICAVDEYCLPLLTADPKQWLQLFQIFPTAFSNPILSSCVHEDPRGPEAKAEPDLTNRSKCCLLCQDLPDTVHTYFISSLELKFYYLQISPSSPSQLVKTLPLLSRFARQPNRPGRLMTVKLSFKL